MLKILRAIETRAEEYDTPMVRAHDEAKADQMNLERQAKELFEVLAMTTEGEAKLMVRSAPWQDGILAWRGLNSHHNRRAMARVLTMPKEAMYPKPVKHISQLISNIVSWEDKWGRMAKGHSTDLPPLWKIAAFIESARRRSRI